MSLNSTPSADRVHIGLFGRRNAGKSSLINALTNQSIAVVSDVKGTTTDPVYKAMELLPLGPVMIIDTPGLDDEGGLGALRVQKAKQVLNKTDIALLVVDSAEGMNADDAEILAKIKEKNIPYLIVCNKCDLKRANIADENAVHVSATTKEGVRELKERIAASVPADDPSRRLVGDLLSAGDVAVLVVPIDKAAPKGRLILPQQQVIRDVLESDASAVVVKETGLRAALENLNEKPKLVVTDSQAFAKAAADTPQDVLLTSFSILFARFKGDLENQIKGAKALDSLQDGDCVLISEGCTHHRQCDDIGSVKIPRWIKEYTGKNITVELSSGTEFPEDLSKYKLIVHCGGCMLNPREMKYRLKCAQDANVPMTNYGVLIAYIHGVLKRSVQAFPDIAALFDKD